MVILSDNPYTVDSDKLADIKVEELILSGKPYESAVTSLGRCICNGLGLVMSLAVCWTASWTMVSDFRLRSVSAPEHATACMTRVI